MDEYDSFIEENAEFLKNHLEDQGWGIEVQSQIVQRLQAMIDEEDGYLTFEDTH